MNKYKCPYDHDQSEFMLEWYEENFEKLINERDELYWKTQEDEREINELRDAVVEKKRQLTEAQEEIEKLKEDIVDYVIKKDDECQALKKALEAL